MGHTPLIMTNATRTRFLYGAFALEDGVPVFVGSVVEGSGFTYDRATGWPVAGTVARVSLQIRSETEVIDVLAVRSHPDTDVALLNHVFEGAAIDWFNPDVAFQRNFKAPPARPAPKTGLCGKIELATGDILTHEDVDDIFGGRIRKVQRLAKRIPPADLDFWDIDPDLEVTPRAAG
ncbi:hypothetical protein [Pseudooctadecabacter jejudonensis]|uniref:Uncharacterized protein n=1 Tax=Pseudooctadecabacter jejudonensis TaxID=1391910 RepID=A0A1Y5RHG0_9RHOB|nr:hypothetical protein [Pseudooctadecabacter jejudonensis]SLN16409.1 hypothetical protein PSJ8397_00420 [Pseudooctadecabacter jejudonensis]